MDFVTCWAAVDGVTCVFIDDFESSCFGDVEIFEAWFVDSAFLDDEACSVGVLLADGDRVGFFDQEGIFVPVNRGVNAQGEDMLMVRSKDPRVNNRSKGDADVVKFMIDGLC